MGHLLTPHPLPERLLYAGPLRRRVRVRFGSTWIADSEDVVLLHEPGRYPVAHFPDADMAGDVLQPAGRTTTHRDLGETSWFAVQAGERRSERAARQHTRLPPHAAVLAGRVASAWRAMDSFHEEDDRILGHAADPYHRCDLRRASRELVVSAGDRIITQTLHATVV